MAGTEQGGAKIQVFSLGADVTYALAEGSL